MVPPKPTGVSERSRRLFGRATGNPPNEPPNRRGLLAKAVPRDAPKDVPKPVPPTTASRPPSEVADKDLTVQNWIDGQPSSPSNSVPSSYQGHEVVRVTPKKQAQPVVKRLFTSPAKKLQQKQRIPFKRARGSGAGGSSNLSSSPGTNWRKQLPNIRVRATISPAKPDAELNATVNPNILIEVVTNNEQSPNKWNVVRYQNQIGSPASTGVWHVEQHSDEAEKQHDVIVSQDDVSDLADILPHNVNGNHEQREPPTFNRKRSSNIPRRITPKVRMVCPETIRPEFYIDEENEDDVDDPNENNDDIQESVPDDNDNSNPDLAVRTETTTSKRKRVDAPRANTRKRVTNKSQWKLSIAKKGYNDGTEYVTSRGKVKPARVMKPPCTEKCNRCQGTIPETERQEIFDNFWALEDIQKKRDYISRLIDENVPTTCSTSPDCAKKSIRRYHFVIGDEEVRVCKTMFINTLGIPDAWVETTLKKITPNGLIADARGKHSTRPTRIPEVTLQSVRDHINLFPRVHSHYTRERTKREYLETSVHSVERMHKLYVEWAKENEIPKPASIATYRKIFNTEFNLGFFLPRKDQCELCAKWKSCTADERRALVKDYATHLENKRKVNALKKSDKAAASETICVACFDLQKVLICPRSEVSLFFYHNKLSLYNFTVFDLRLTEGHCYLWTETDACKGANEIGTNLLQFIERKIDEGIKEFIFYSDSPTGQNRNRMIFSLYLYASAKYNLKIVHRFLESGHSYSEADNMHALIEKEAKIQQQIFTPEEWTTLIKGAKQDGKPYLVNHLMNEDVLDLHALVKQEDWEKDTDKKKVFWSKVREVAADYQSPNCMFYRYNFTDEPSKVIVRLKTGGTTDMKKYKFPQAYNSKFPLAEKKKKDIQNLMRKGAIPAKYHATFDHYLAI